MALRCACICCSTVIISSAVWCRPPAWAPDLSIAMICYLVKRTHAHSGTCMRPSYVLLPYMLLLPYSALQCAAHCETLCAVTNGTPVPTVCSWTSWWRWLRSGCFLVPLPCGVLPTVSLLSPVALQCAAHCAVCCHLDQPALGEGAGASHDKVWQSDTPSPLLSNMLLLRQPAYDALLIV
jgi:hypothetical protein